MNDFQKKIKEVFASSEAKEYMKSLAKKGNEKRWANHTKMTDEERKAKRAAYQRDWRKKKKGKG